MRVGFVSGVSTLRDRLTGPGMGVPAALAAAAVALGAGTGVLQWQAHIHSEQDTARVESLQAARETTAAILSYTPDTVDSDLAARTGRLTGGFLDEYTTLMNTTVIPNAKKGNVTTVAEVPGAASVSVTGSRAVALVFVDQSVTGAAAGQTGPVLSSFSVRVTLDKIGDRWLVSEFRSV
jgi:Mce-associated membrane protein